MTSYLFLTALIVIGAIIQQIDGSPLIAEGLKLSKDDGSDGYGYGLFGSKLTKDGGSDGYGYKHFGSKLKKKMMDLMGFLDQNWQKVMDLRGVICQRNKDLCTFSSICIIS